MSLDRLRAHAFARPATRGRERQYLIGSVLAVLLSAVLSGCGSPDPSTFSAALDELQVPDTWELVDTRVTAPGVGESCTSLMGSCPRVARYFLAEGMPIENQPAARTLLTAGGYAIEEELSPDCDIPPSSAACALLASRGSIEIQVNLYNPGDDFDDIGVEDPSRSLIRVTAWPR